MASKDIYALPSSEVPDLDVKRDVSPTADVESHEKINHVEANMMPAQRRSNLFSMLAGGAGLLADGYQNSLASSPESCPINRTNATAANRKRHFQTDLWSVRLYTQVSGTNREWWVFRLWIWILLTGVALLVGTILGQFSMGFVVDRVGRKAAMTITTLFIVLGGILGTVAHAPSAVGFFWFITVARGMVGYGAGGEYPAASTAVRHSSFDKISKFISQSIEGAEASFKKHRGFFFMMTTTGCLITGQLLTLIVCLSEPISLMPICLYLYVQSSWERPSTTTPLSPPS
jgi:MFS family permease